MKTLFQLRNENAIPTYALVQIPDGWQLAGVARHEANRFEWQPCYKKDGVTMTETEMLKAGIAYYYIELGQLKRRVFTLAA